MTDRPTGRSVALPLVWRGDRLWIGKIHVVGSVVPYLSPQWFARAYPKFSGPFPTRADAERAVEDAVVAALEQGGGE
jgi:hypothetical protein